MKQDTCETQIEQHLKGRLHDVARLMEADDNGCEGEDIGTLAEYGLSFDYVEAGTFEHKAEGYFRYQHSRCSPSDEFRFFTDRICVCHCIILVSGLIR